MNAHPAALIFKKHYNFCKKNTNCDLQLISADDQKVNIHSGVLYAAIPHLRKTLLENDKNNVKKIRLTEVKGREMNLLIQYAYLGKCELQEGDKSAVLELIKAAKYLRMINLEHEMLDTLKNDLDMDLALKVLACKDNVNLKHAVQMAEDHLFRHALDADVALNLDFEKFKALLSDDRLHALHEEQVWEAIVKWVSANLEGRSNKLAVLMSTLRLGFMSLDSIQKISNHPLLAQNTNALSQLHKSVDIARAYQMPTPSLKVNRLPLEVRPRIPHISILAIGGWRTEEHLCKLAEAYDVIADKWTSVPDLMLNHRRGYHGLQKIGGFVYLIGGGDTNGSLRTCLKLDLELKKWSSISSMRHARCFVSTTVLDGELYAIGGREHEHRLKSAEKYNPLTDTWMRICDTHNHHSDAAAATLDGKVYVVGGFNGNEVLNSLECYSPDTNTWMTLPPMNKPRSGLTCVAHRGQLFVFGGFDGTMRLRDGERYNPKTHAWTALAPMMLPRSTFQLVRVEDVLYAIGGYSEKPEASVEAYDVIGDKWYTLTDMLEPTSALSCVAIDDLTFSQYIWSTSSRDDPKQSLRNFLQEHPPYHPPNSNLTLPDGTLDIHHPQFSEPLSVPWADLFVANDHQFDLSDEELDFLDVDDYDDVSHSFFDESDVSTDRDDN